MVLHYTFLAVSHVYRFIVIVFITLALKANVNEQKCWFILQRPVSLGTYWFIQKICNRQKYVHFAFDLPILPSHQRSFNDKSNMGIL